MGFKHLPFGRELNDDNSVVRKYIVEPRLATDSLHHGVLCKESRPPCCETLQRNQLLDFAESLWVKLSQSIPKRAEVEEQQSALSTPWFSNSKCFLRQLGRNDQFQVSCKKIVSKVTEGPLSRRMCEDFGAPWLTNEWTVFYMFPKIPEDWC